MYLSKEVEIGQEFAECFVNISDIMKFIGSTSAHS